MSSFTLTLSGNTSSLTANYFPPIELDPNSNYVCCLVDFQTYNSIPNISINNNKLHVKKMINIILQKGSYSEEDFYEKTKDLSNSQVDWKEGIHQIAIGPLNYEFPKGSTIHLLDDNEYSRILDITYEIPVGSYELNDIIKFFHEKLPMICITVDLHTVKCSIEIKDENLIIDFKHNDSVRKVLGFKSRILKPKKGKYIADHPINIIDINAIRIDCNIASGSYLNGQPSHNIHEFYPNVASGYKIVEVPRNLIYLPVVGHTIHKLELNITDQNGNLINFRGEKTTCRIHIKKDL